MTFAIESNSIKNIKVEVESSLIDYMRYSQEDFSLTVKYKSGSFFKKKVKRYQEIPPEQFFEMLECKSVGKAFMKLRSKLRSR